MLTRRRAAVVLIAALLWTIWILARYYAWPLGRPEIADGLRGSTFPYWREAVRGGLTACWGAALTLWAAWGFGAAALHGVSRAARGGRADLFGSIVERGSFRLGCGLAVLSLACLALAGLRAYRPLPLYVLTGLGIALTLVPTYRALRRGRVHARPRRLSLDTVLPGLCVLGALACAFAGALAPEIEYDALWYHLWLPQRWLSAGQPVDIVEEYVSLYPLFWQLVYGLAMTLGGAGAAKLLHFACLPLVAAATWLLTSRIFPGANAWLAAALAVASPLMIWEGTTAYNDLALAWYLTLAVYALSRCDASQDRRWAVIAGVMLGASLAIKHLALLACVAIALVAAVHLLTAGPGVRRHWRTAVLVAAIAVSIPAPWYARAYVHSGNPFFPDLYSVFGARPHERWSSQTEAGLTRFKERFGPERSIQGLATLPWDMTVHGARYGGTLGPLFLILVPWAFARGVRRQAWLVTAGVVVYGGLWASPISSFQMRFIVPLVPPLAALGAAGAASLTAAVARLIPRASPAVVVSTSLLVAFNLPPFTGWHERDRSGDQGWLTHVVRALPLRVVLGAVSRAEYKGQMVSSFVAWSYIDKVVPHHARVLTFSGGDHLYSTRRRLWSDATAAHPITWGGAIGQERLVHQRAQALGITHVLFDRTQIAGGQLSELAIASDVMKLCCLRLLYEDSRFQLYALSPAFSR